MFVKLDVFEKGYDIITLLKMRTQPCFYQIYFFLPSLKTEHIWSHTKDTVLVDRELKDITAFQPKQGGWDLPFFSMY